MANKGRRLTSSRSERYLGSSYQFNPSQQSVNGASELGEDEVWSTGHDDEDAVTGYSSTPRERFVVDPPRRRPPRSSSDAATARHRLVGGLSLAFDDDSTSRGGSPRIVNQFRPPQDGGSAVRLMATSAPVNVPDWSRIYRVDSVHDDDVDDDDESSEVVPPHEYLARSRRTAANSVFEGVGRTLKGRDLSRVRDAVWSQTGFYG